MRNGEFSPAGSPRSPRRRTILCYPRMSPDQDPDRKQSPWVQVGRYSQLAFMLPAGTVAGWLLGSLLDHWCHTTWISIVGLLLGTAGGLVELIRQVSRDTK